MKIKNDIKEVIRLRYNLLQPELPKYPTCAGLQLSDYIVIKSTVSHMLNVQSGIGQSPEWREVCRFSMMVWFPYKEALLKSCPV